MSAVGTVVSAGSTVIGVKAKWFMIAAAVAGWTAFVAVSANTVTRNHYKAGMVDSLKLRNKALQDSVVVKDDLLGQAMVVQGFSKEQMATVLGAFVEVSVRQPVNTQTIRTQIKDAPQKYAAFDPKQCLAYAFPDGMQDDQRRAIASFAAQLPQFDLAGRPIIQPSANGGTAP